MIRQVLITACDLVFATRPLILIPAWSFYLLGAAATPDATYGLPSPTTLLSLTAILAMAYLLNQVFDRVSDERNDKCFFLARGIFRVRTFVLLAFVLFAAGSAAYHRAPSNHHGALLAALVLSLIYSLPPIRLCSRPVLDAVANAVGYGGIAWLLGYLAGGGEAGEGWRPALPYVFLVASVFLHTTLLDEEGDRMAGKQSTAVWLGTVRTARLALLLHGVALLAAILYGNATAVWVNALAMPASVFAWRRRQRAASSIAVQGATIIVTAAAMWHWPAYAVVVIPLLWAARVYYYRRFGIRYPGPPRTA